MNMMENTDTVNIVVTNKCPYPIRILKGFEDNMQGLYMVLQPFARVSLEVTLLVLDNLSLNPKISITQATDEEF